MALASTEMPRFADGTIDMQELLRQLAESIANETMSAEADQPCDETGTSRNGYRGRKLITCVGTLDLRIPKTREGTFFPDDVLVRYQRVDRALVSAMAEMYATGTSTRKVQRVAQELGVERLSKGQMGAIAQSLDESLEVLRTRPLGDIQMPYIWLDGHLREVPQGRPCGLHGRRHGHRLRLRRLEACAGHLRRGHRVVRLLARLPAEAQGPRHHGDRPRRLRCP